MKKILFILALLLMPTVALADSPAYNIVQFVPNNIIAGSNVSLNYSFQIRTTDTVPVYFQFNISANNTNTTRYFNITGTFINRVYCEQNSTSYIISCYDNNTEIYLGANSYNLYLWLYVLPNIEPNNYTISMNIVSEIKQVDYQLVTNTVYYNSGGGIQTIYQNVTIIKEVPKYISNETIIYRNITQNVTHDNNVTQNNNIPKDNTPLIVMLIIIGIFLISGIYYIANELYHKHKINKVDLNEKHK